jgi:hypothetical protein
MTDQQAAAAGGPHHHSFQVIHHMHLSPFGDSRSQYTTGHLSADEAISFIGTRVDEHGIDHAERVHPVNGGTEDVPGELAEPGHTGIAPGTPIGKPIPARVPDEADEADHGAQAVSDDGDER